MIKFLMILTFSFLFLQSNLFAFVKPIHHHAKSGAHSKKMKVEVLRPDLYEASTNISVNGAYNIASVKRDRLNKSIRILSGDFGVVQERRTRLQHYKEFSLDFLVKNFSLFKVDVSQLKLIEKATYLGEDVQFIQFALLKNNLIIADSSISFRFKGKKLVQIANYSFAEASVGKMQGLSEHELTFKVNKAIPNKSLKTDYEIYRVQQASKNYQLIKVSHYNVVSLDGIELDLQVDVTTGEIFELKESKLYFNGRAAMSTYPRWYNEELSLQPLAYAKIKSSPSFPNLVSNHQGLFNVDNSVSKLYVSSLSGKYIFIKNQTGDGISGEGLKSEGSWALNLETRDNSNSPWLNKTVAQGMVYTHINKMIEHALNYIHPTWFDKPLQANTNLSRTCNAHWDGRTINFYSGDSRCGNTGLIADVIYHEWGHGLDANTGGIQDGAFSEGFGDIMSLLMTRSHLLGIGFMVRDSAPVRDLAPNKIYPRDRGGVHAEGLIIGSTFWDLFEGFSKKYDEDKAVHLLSNYILKGIYTARNYTDVYDAILVIDDDDSNLENGTPNICLINKVFSEHGLARKLTWCRLAAVKEFDARDEDGDGVLEPGERVSLYVTAFNPGTEAITDLKGKVTASHKSVVFEEANMSWGTIAANSSAVSTVPAKLFIKENITCGENFKLKFHLSSGAREAFAEKSFVVGKNQGTAESYEATGLPQPIEDYKTTKSTVAVGGDQWGSNPDLAKAQLKFKIKHTYIGDLVVSLVSPSGKKIQVYKGNSGDDDVAFDEDITDKFRQIKGKGNWTLEVFDKSLRDKGSLESFNIILTPNHYVCN